MAVKGLGHVPKFGDWESAGTPYTVVFENARKQKGEKIPIINPNDPAFFLPGGGGAAEKITIINPNDPSFRGGGGKNVPRPSNPPRVPRNNNSNHNTRRQSPSQAKVTGVSPSEQGSQKSMGPLQSSKLPPLRPESVGDKSSHRPHFQRGSYPSPGKAPSPSVHLNMVQAPTVPKFGNWKDQPVVEKYTEIFESIRNEKTGSMPCGNTSHNNIQSPTTMNQKSVWLFTCCFGTK